MDAQQLNLMHQRDTALRSVRELQEQRDALAAENAELKRLLAPFAESIADCGDVPDDLPWDVMSSVGHLRKVVAALAQKSQNEHISQ
jgi:hypothetical protein